MKNIVIIGSGRAGKMIKKKTGVMGFLTKI